MVRGLKARAEKLSETGAVVEVLAADRSAGEESRD
jgi:hypothetical protein